LRLLLDENIPVALSNLLTGHEVETVRGMGWLGLANGRLLTAAEKAGFDALLTADKGIPHQLHLEGRRIAIVELSTNHWATLEATIGRILEALQAMMPGTFLAIDLPRPPRRRRPMAGSQQT
jgi:predicted nuclease of predicted toxin-antitoxin system